MKELVFYNSCNNGDIHVSRALVEYTIDVAREQYPGITFRYLHRNSPRLTIDMPEIKYGPLTEMPKLLVASDLRSFKYGDTVYFNTWYAASPIFKGMYCTLNTLHELFRANLKEWFNHALDPNVGKFLPEYDETLLQTDGIQMYMSHPNPLDKTKVLLCNGQPMSGQSNMPSAAFETAMQRVISDNPSALFIVTNPETHRFEGDNIVYTRDILDVEGCDLPEIAALSAHCDTIIGRGSGPYSFSLTHDNLTDPDCVFVCFTDDERVARWVYMSDVVEAKILWSNKYEVENMQRIVNDVLKEKISGG